MDEINVTLIITACISGLLPIIATALTTHLHNKSALQRARSEALIHAAIEDWRGITEAQQLYGKSFDIDPLDSYIIHMQKLGEVIFDPTTNEQNIADRLLEIRHLKDAARRAWLR